MPEIRIHTAGNIPQTQHVNRVPNVENTGLQFLSRGLSDVAGAIARGVEIDNKLEAHANALDLDALSKEYDNQVKQHYLDLVDDPNVINDPFKYMTEFDKRSRDSFDSIIARARNDTIVSALAQHYRDMQPAYRRIAQGNQRKLATDYVTAKLVDMGTKSAETAGETSYDMLAAKVEEFNMAVSNEVAGGLIDQVQAVKMKQAHKEEVYKNHMEALAQTNIGRSELYERNRLDNKDKMNNYDMVPIGERNRIMDLANRLEREQEARTTTALNHVEAYIKDYWMSEAGAGRIDPSFVEDVKAGKFPMLERTFGDKLEEKMNNPTNSAADRAVRLLRAEYAGEEGAPTEERVARYIRKLNKLRDQSPNISKEMEQTYTFLLGQRASVRAEQNTQRGVAASELGNALRYIDTAVEATAPPISGVPFIENREKILKNELKRRAQQDRSLRNQEAIDKELDKARARKPKAPTGITPDDLRK